MGIRTTFVTEDIDIKWPEWFIEKYKVFIHFKPNHTGAISSITEAKLTHHLPDLEKDIQKAIDWKKINRFRLVFMHEEVSFINRPIYVEITQDKIKYYESLGRKEIDRDYLECENRSLL